ncbi:MAG: DUF5060 domain-containing protein [Bacteroidetes bacterium]|nr:DUF5060 domain-containing protein [Bacteroidota bacterium]
MKNLCIAALLILFCFKINAAGTIVGTIPITGTSIGMFEKFEVGVQLSASYSNPYDPDVVSLQAVFTSPSGKQYPVNGFFYRDYTTDDTKQACDDNPITYSAHWKELATSYNWRLRFAPNEIGAWTYTITLYESASHNTVVYHNNNLHFDCSPSSNHGYLAVSGNKRFLEYTDRTSFFGIASNFSFYNGRNTLPTSVLPAASCSLVNGCTLGPQCAPLCSNPNGFRHTTVAQAMMTKWLSDFSAVGGNMARVWMTPTCGLGIEWEKLNNYDNRQNRAWELDNLIDLCHTKGIYIPRSP